MAKSWPGISTDIKQILKIRVFFNHKWKCFLTEPDQDKIKLIHVFTFKTIVLVTEKARKFATAF